MHGVTEFNPESVSKGLGALSQQPGDALVGQVANGYRIQAGMFLFAVAPFREPRTATSIFSS